MSIFDKFKKKIKSSNKNTEDSEDDSKRAHRYKHRIRAIRAKKFSVIAIILIAVVITTAIIWISYNNKVYYDYSVSGSVEYKKVEGSNVISFGTKFLTYSADGIHCTNAKGTDVWSVPFEMQSPMVAVSGEYVACADLNGRTVYVFGSDGEKGRIQTSSPIKNIDVSGDGVVVVVTEDDDVTPIDVYTYDGQKIVTFRTTMSKSGYPLAISISDNSKLFAVSYLYLDSGTLTTKLALYNFGDVGQNETDNLVSGYDYKDEVIPVVEFLNNSTLVAIGSDKLLFFSGKERPTNSASVDLEEEILAAFYGDNKTGLLFADTTGAGRYRLDTYSSKGNKLSSIIVDLEYTDIFYANDMIVIYNSTSAVIYKSNGKLKYRGDFDDSVALMIPTSSPLKYTLVTPDSIKSIKLK